jgi:hypothetical protein
MVMGESPEIELVRRAWDAAEDGPQVLGEVLPPDAQWYGVEDGQLCDGREAIIEVMSRSLAACEAGRGNDPRRAACDRGVPSRAVGAA